MAKSFKEFDASFKENSQNIFSDDENIPVNWILKKDKKPKSGDTIIVNNGPWFMRGIYCEEKDLCIDKNKLCIEFDKYLLFKKGCDDEISDKK